jgi:branched-chain amino acid transport system ATP-binding protein
MIVRSGIAHCPEERRIWPELTVHENLALGAYICRDRSEVKRRMEAVLTRFPRLRERSEARNSQAPFPVANSKCWPSVVR